MSRETIEALWGPYREMTEEEMRQAVAELPEDLRERLATGPHPRRFTCHVCDVLGVPDPSSAAHRVTAYHEVPKLQMRRAEDQWYGRLANDVYRRCLAIYRAAGWTGEAPEPNA